MSDLIYNQVNPLVRIEESNLLSMAFFEDMLNQPNFEKGKECLRQTVYGDFINREDFSLHFETYLRNEEERLFKKMYGIAPEKEVIDIFSLRYSYHNLKLLTKAYHTNQNLDEYFLYDGYLTKESIKNAIATQTSNSLTGYFLESIQDVHREIMNYKELRVIDIVYDRYFFMHLKQSAETVRYPEVLAVVNTFIDLTNISTVIRGIREKQTANFLETVLSDQGTLEQKKLASFASEKLAVFTEYLLTTDYKEMIRQLLNKETGEIDISYLHRERDNQMTAKYQTAKLQAFGPLPILALLNAKDTEVKNISLILVGLKNNFPKEVIKERIRKTYAD